MAPTITTMGTRGDTVLPSASPALAVAARDSASLDKHTPARDQWRSDSRGETATFGSTITRPWANILRTERGGAGGVEPRQARRGTAGAGSGRTWHDAPELDALTRASTDASVAAQPGMAKTVG